MRPVAAPLAPSVGAAWTARFGLVWLGLWAAQLAPVQLLLPLQLADLDPAHKVRDFGLVNGLAGIAALVALPVFGALCDRTRSPFGRRRVWVAAGVVVYVGGLLLTGAADGVAGVAGGWLVAQLGMYAAMAGLTATIADQVPAEQRGAVSAAVYGPQALGIVVGLVLVTGLGEDAGYPALAVLLLLAALPWLLRARDTPAVARPQSLAAAVRATWAAPSRHPDYAWAFGGRLLVNLGNALGTTYLLYFLTDGLRVADPEGSLLVLTVVYLLATVAATWGGGLLSDRTGRRRVFVAGAAVLQALACAVLVAVPSWPSALVAGLLLGAGYGAYTSVDQALVTQVLPDARTVAGDLGVMNVAVVVPQALAPLLASLVIAELGGYDVLFALAGVVSVLGALSVARIRTVR
ncbi:Permease of the major facilitator superfamily [Modestobacter italicus]|uniref:Permease of the major facilitator superfamily n=1 Tax=Modestobacter italicus (strain DSM 44449 / CECT 9708 / BC 501) TaxID=2732864 RepID=I4ETV9_MODI5|nr:MFS transporter [Modestobacter marinus]CCH86822.1 Permease of the major facilitator superfamily [Modestobacter marinus]